jgi:hypothetical protein
MSTFTIGRLTIPCDPDSVRWSGGPTVISLGGEFTGSSLPQLKALRDEIAQTITAGQVITVTWTEDTTLNGFYRPRPGGQVDLRSLSGTGYVAFSVDLELLGRSACFQSLLTGKALANDHSYSATEVGFVGPPDDHWGYWPTTALTVLRAFDGGSMRTHRDVPATDQPTWYVAAGDYYTAACEITVDSYVRAGAVAPNTPTSWTLSNGLVRVSATTNGALNVEHYDSTAWRSVVWKVEVDASAVGDWKGIRILDNRPERAAIRLTQSRSNQGRWTLDVGVRRGSRIVDGVLHSDTGGGALELDTDDSTGTTTSVPTGTLARSSVDTHGHRWIIGSEKSTTLSTTNGSMTKTASRLPFMISSQINEGAGVQDGDEIADLWDQYMNWRSETVRLISP